MIDTKRKGEANPPATEYETILRPALEAVVDKVGKVAVTDCFAPSEIAQKAEAVGVTKTKFDTVKTILLGILAGVFIGLGAMFFTVVTTNSGLGFGMNRLVGGLVFCIGLILVVVAGAELFTGNNLIIIGWISGRTTLARLLRNWVLVYFANFAGALSLAVLIYYSGQWSFNSNGVGANALAIANAKVNLDFGVALTRGILCNVLVCLAVWLCFGARSVTDKVMATLFPITAFVAAGFEHSIANMYFIPLGIMLSDQPAVLEAAKLTSANVANLNWMGFLNNMVPVTIGNIIGGAILIGVVYWLAYLRSERVVEVAMVRPWLGSVIPGMATRADESARTQLGELVRKQKEPLVLEKGGKAILDVLDRASKDSEFFSMLATNPAEALKTYDLTPEERAAISSGDIRWIESRLGPLSPPLRTWLNYRLTQEKW